MSVLKENFSLNINIFRRVFFGAAFLCLSAGNVFTQNLPPSEISHQADRLQRGDTETRRDALHKLRASESENASRIAAEGLTDKTEIVRATAPFSVLSLPSDEAAEQLLAQLKDKSPYVRRETAYALCKTRSLRGVQPLVETLLRDKDYSVRSAAAVALGEIGDNAALTALTGILERSPRDSEEFLRRSAARSIGQIAETTLQREFLAQTEIKDYAVFAAANRRFLSQKNPAFRAAVDILLKTLQNPREADDPKREAAFALGAIGDSRAASPLQKSLNAEDYYLAENSRAALQKILILK